MHVRWLMPAGAAIAQVAFAAQYMTVEQTQRAAFPQATEFRDVPSPDVATLQAVGAVAGWSPHVFDARNGAQHLGWLIVDQVIGKSELITYSLAIDADGKVLGVEVLEYRESHGSEIRLAPWRKQFVGKTVQDPIELNKDIKNISGATLSCRHVTEGVQRLLKYAATLKTPS
jgi:Na+-translocating ferredoxin:NAD+ oxidoreductase RnfG subunit